MASLNSKLQLALLNRKKGRNLLQKGFTLVELMIVIVIVGVLSAVALPNLLGNRDRAEAQSQIGSAVSFAKQCAAHQLSQAPLSITNIPSYITGTGAGSTHKCYTLAVAGTGGGTGTPAGPVSTTFIVGTYANTANLEGLQCSVDANGDPVLNDATQGTCTLTVNNGAVTGVWN